VAASTATASLIFLRLPGNAGAVMAGREAANPAEPKKT
jgi:hypothetical protein